MNRPWPALHIPRLAYAVSPRSVHDAADLVRLAVRSGYRHIDLTASPDVAAFVRQSLANTGVFLTVPVTAGAPAELLANLRRHLGVEQLDLCVLDLDGLDDPCDDWRRVTDAVLTGAATMAGVRNASEEQLRKLAAATGRMPAVNQVVLNPHTPRATLRAVHRSHGIVTAALKPMADWENLLARPEVTRIARRLRRTEAQVAIRWHLRLDNVVITSPVHAGRIESNARVFEFRADRRRHARAGNVRRRGGESGAGDLLTRAGSGGEGAGAGAGFAALLTFAVLVDDHL